MNSICHGCTMDDFFKINSEQLAGVKTNSRIFKKLCFVISDANKICEKKKKLIHFLRFLKSWFCIFFFILFYLFYSTFFFVLLIRAQKYLQLIEMEQLFFFVLNEHTKMEKKICNFLTNYKQIEHIWEWTIKNNSNSKTEKI